MREIKFRVWDKECKYMHICGEDVHDTINFDIETNRAYYYNLQNGCGSLSEDSDYVLMQYTGLKDKNGKEIYEGDVIKSYFENGLGAENKCLIIYDEYLCAFMGKELRTKQQYLFNEGNPNKKDKKLKYTEVIGNIYDNPELLEEEI